MEAPARRWKTYLTPKEIKIDGKMIYFSAFDSDGDERIYNYWNDGEDEMFTENLKVGQSVRVAVYPQEKDGKKSYKVYPYYF